MKNQISSLTKSFIFIYLYFLATKGVVRLLWNSKQTRIFDLRVKFLLLITPMFSFVYIVVLYHLLGHSRVKFYYMILIILLALYFFGGLLTNEIYNALDKYKNKK